MNKLYLISFISLLFFQSCSLLDERGPMPAFIKIDKLEVVTNEEEQGPANHELKYVEVYFENQSIGFYEVPFEIAVIPTMNTSKLVIFPAILENNVSRAVTTYEMLTPFIVEQNFEVEKHYELEPVFTYRDNVDFVFVETFESNHIFTQKLDTFSNTEIITTDTTASYGNKSGLLEVNGEEALIATTSFSNTNLADGGLVYLEFEFKNTIPFIIGIIGDNGQNDIISDRLIQLPVKDEWHKVYLNLTRPILILNKENIRTFLAINGQGEGGEGFIDNVRLLYKK